MQNMRQWSVICALALVCTWSYLKMQQVPRTENSQRIVISTGDALAARLSAKGMLLGSPIFIRVFKESHELELWMKTEERFALFHTYPILKYSGELGPKLKEGDRQAPEGFYEVGPQAMNPNSRYHLSFNLGYPNAYDQAHGRTGSYLMIHGSDVSIGCYAMGDAGIEEIYTLAQYALDSGQDAFHVHCFPFRMTAANMDRHTDNPWYNFWITLKQGYDAFDTAHQVPAITVTDHHYSVENASP